MQGFKSFADPVCIELNDGITCIIGPNGSGKSNISDALRWVLGEQSSKQLRGNKMQDVIFAGTATRKPKGMAEVTLVIDNSTGILPLEYNEVAVTRRMFRSGESEYLINGSQCRLRDIRELFMDTGIGVEGYSIIGQGKIADIVSTKPENRRQIFEEAAGVVLYKTRKTEAENKLKTASVNLERVRDIISEIEGRIGGLKDESEKAAEYLELRERYKTLSINIRLHNLDSLTESVDAGHTELRELAEKIAAEEARLTELEEAAEKSREDDASLSESYADANSELLSVIEELNTIMSGGELNKEKLANIEREITRLQTETEASEEKLVSGRTELEELETRDRELNDEANTVREELRQAVMVYNDHSAESAGINTEIERLRSLMIDLSNDNVGRKAEITTLSRYKNTLEERSETLREDFEGRDRQEAENRSNLERLEAEITESGKVLEEEKEKIFEIANNIILVNKHIQELSAFHQKYFDSYDFSGKRILVAEDMEINREIAREMLRQTGAVIEFAADGQDCVEKVKANPADYYDLILMDISMPNMDGIEAARMIRTFEDRTKASVPIIAVSANVQEKDRNAALEAGMDGFTEKPIFVDKLFEAMKQYLSEDS